MKHKLERVAVHGRRYGLSFGTLLASCEDFGCATEEEYIAHMESILRSFAMDSIQVALSQEGAISAMTIGEFHREGDTKYDV